MVDVLAFQLGESRCAFPVPDVQEVLPVVALSPIPGQEPPLEGMLNLRGSMLPVFDLRACFGLASVRWTERTRIIVVNAQHGRIGVIVDHVEDVIKMNETEETASAPVGNQKMVGAIQNVGGKALTLLRPGELIHDRQLSAVHLQP